MLLIESSDGQEKTSVDLLYVSHPYVGLNTSLFCCVQFKGIANLIGVE